MTDRRKLALDIISSKQCYKEFYCRYLVGNRPCLLGSSFTESWPCRKLWVNNGKPNWDYLKKNYGEAVAPVANCDDSYYNSHLKADWPISKYIAYIESLGENKANAPNPCYYLKDWHFAKAFPDLNPVYTTPVYFASDWLNEYWITRKEDDYRFVYIGPKGSWTPFHSDVYGSFSWSANIVGKKRWIFFPPGEELKLQTVFGTSQTLNDLSTLDLQSLEVCYLDLIQSEGEIIFVPSGWYHQVWNLEDTISINHNWLNGSNINLIYSALVKAAEEVKDEFQSFGVEDVDQEKLETVLNCHHGMNFTEFRRLLETIVQRRESKQVPVMIHNSEDCPVCRGEPCNKTLHEELDKQLALEMLDKMAQLQRPPQSK